MERNQQILIETLRRLELITVKPDDLLAQMRMNGYADPDMLAELFSSEKAPLLQDLKESCEISQDDFTKMQQNYVKTFQQVVKKQSELDELNKQETQTATDEASIHINGSTYFRKLRENQFNTTQRADGNKSPRKCGSRSNSSGDDRKQPRRGLTNKEVDQLMTPRNKKQERPVESDDETAAKRVRIKSQNNFGTLLVSKQVQKLIDLDEKHIEKIKDIQTKYTERANQYADKFHTAPGIQIADQSRIMIRNVQNTIDEYQTSKPNAEIPVYSEQFPKPEKLPKPCAKPIPDFEDLPQFQFKEPPALIQLQKVQEQENNVKSDTIESMRSGTEIVTVVDLDGEDEDPEPQQIAPRIISSSIDLREPQQVAPRIVQPQQDNNNVQTNGEKSSYMWRGQRFFHYGPGEYLNKIPVHDEQSAKKCRLDLSKEFPKDPESRYESWNRKKKKNKPIIGKRIGKVQDIAVANYLRKPVKRKKLAAGHVSLEQLDDPDAISIVPERLPKSIEKNFSFDDLGNNTALLERNKKKNFDGKKIRGLNKNDSMQDMITQQTEESEYNKHGRQKHEIVSFTEQQHIRQLNFAKYTTPFKASVLADEPLIDDGSSKSINLHELLKIKELSYYQLMKAIIDQRLFKNIAEVRILMQLTERSGLKMIEWSTRQADNLIIFRCKKYPSCHALLNFEINHALTGRPKLHSTKLKHLHPPDWNDKTGIKREVWAVLTYPSMQQKLKSATDQFRSMDELYYIAEEYAIIESLDFSAVTEEQFAIFYQMYINMTRVEQTPYNMTMGKEIHPKPHLNKRDKKILEKQISEMNTQIISQSQTQQQSSQVISNSQIVQEIQPSSNVSQANTNHEAQQKKPQSNKLSMSEVEQIEQFYQNTTEQVRPLAPNKQAIKIQNQLIKQFGDDLVIHCSNNESMLFFTFQEQVSQSASFVQNKMGGSTMLILGGFKTQMSGMNLLLFVIQSQTTMNFILVAGCLILEEIAQAETGELTIDYSWIFSVYAASKLPVPSFCMTEFNEGLYKALRSSWPKVLHGWSGSSIIRKGEDILSNITDEETEKIKRIFVNFVRNQTKTSQSFKVKYRELLNLVIQWKNKKQKSFLAYLKQIKDQKLKWARYALAWDTEQFFNNQNLFFGDLILIQKQKYIYKVIQRIILRQQGMRLSQVIRSFEYLSTFGYHKNALKGSYTKQSIRLKTELHISQSCIDLVETNISPYLALKILNMASKCTNYHVQSVELDVFKVRQTSQNMQIDDESCNSADSDTFGNLKTDQPLEVCFSQLDQAFYCQCQQIKLLGYPCVHILRVISFKKQKIECNQNFSVQYEDIKSYFATHISKPPKDDLISFDVTNPVTLDREKQILSELLADKFNKQLPPMNRDQIFSDLAQKIKVEKLMNYKPKHREFENPEILISDDPSPASLFQSLSFKVQIKLSQGDVKGEYSSSDAFTVLVQDLLLKNIVNQNCLTDIIRQNMIKSMRALKKKNYEAAQSYAYQTLDPTQKKKQFEFILMASLETSHFTFNTNRFCKKQGSAIMVLKQNITDIEQAIQDHLNICICKECPALSEISSIPNAFFVKFNQDCPLTTLKTQISINNATYELHSIIRNHPYQKKQQVSLILKMPQIVATAQNNNSQCLIDQFWPGWFFYSSYSTRKSACYNENDSGQDQYEGGYAQPITRHQFQRCQSFKKLEKSAEPQIQNVILCYTLVMENQNDEIQLSSQ